MSTLREEIAAIVSHAQAQGRDTHEQATCVAVYMEWVQVLDLADSGSFDDDPGMQKLLGIGGGDDPELYRYLRLIKAGLEAQGMSMPEWIVESIADNT